MATRIFLIRHGATELSSEDRFAGEVDVALSEIGRNQARRLSERLASEKVAAIYASPLGRTRETAEIIAAPHRIPIQLRPALREISHGHWEGKRRSQVEQLYPKEYAQWEEDPFTFAPPAGETGLEVTSRALPALLEIVEQSSGGQAIIVSHKATIRLLLSTLLGFDPRKYRDRLDQSPAALNILDFKGLSHARLMLFNDTSHYAPEAGIPEMPQGRLSKVWDEAKKVEG
jgi:broad specificity phosphatase PhoE